MKVYLDYNATSPLLPGLAGQMAEVSERFYGNPSSLHQQGRAARDLLEASRQKVADFFGVARQEITFTSGGSESNNTVLRQLLLESPRHLITSQIEHPSVLTTCRVLERVGWQVTYLPVTSSGQVLPESLQAALRPETRLISVMTANNETGVIQPLAELTACAQAAGVPLHSDSVQAVGKQPLDWKGWGLSYASATGHKLGGPRGVGVLYVAQGAGFDPLITGGKQERVRRAGTESLPLVVGLATALDWWKEHGAELQKRFTQERQRLIEYFRPLPGFFLNGEGSACLPHTLNFGFEGFSAESLLIALDLEGIAISTGSACSSGAIEASHVLLAMGLEKKRAKSCLRLSLGWATTSAEIEQVAERLRFHVERLHAKKKS